MTLCSEIAVRKLLDAHVQIPTGCGGPVSLLVRDLGLLYFTLLVHVHAHVHDMHMYMHMYMYVHVLVESPPPLTLAPLPTCLAPSLLEPVHVLEQPAQVRLELRPTHTRRSSGREPRAHFGPIGALAPHAQDGPLRPPCPIDRLRPGGAPPAVHLPYKEGGGECRARRPRLPY